MRPVVDATMESPRPAKRVKFCEDSDSSVKELSGIVDKLSNENVGPTTVDLIKQLQSLLPLLESKDDTIVKNIMKASFKNCLQLEDGDVYDTVTSAYLDVITKILAHHVGFAQLCCAEILKAFLLIETDSYYCDDSGKYKRFHHFLHLLLQNIMRNNLIPEKSLIRRISKYFPYVKKPAEYQLSYIRNVLELGTYTPCLQSKLLMIIIDKLVVFDLNAPREEIVDAEDSDEENLAAASSETDEECVGSSRFIPSDNPQLQDVVMFDMDGFEESRTGNSRKMKHEMANTLDLLMVEMFEYIKSHASKPANVIAIYQDLFAAFEQSILQTWTSCHIQFLLFYLLSFDSSLVERFTSKLWEYVEAGASLNGTKQRCIGYLASLLARAKYITLPALCRYLKKWAQWLQLYIKNVGDVPARTGSETPIITTHSTFYGLSQALFYVITFRHREIFEDAVALEYLQHLNLNNIVYCHLNPLKFCMPKIAQTFATVMKMFQLVYCYEILEKNRKDQFVQTNAGTPRIKTNGPGTIKQNIDIFLPFEPYLLQKSSSFLTNLYKDYDSSLITSTSAVNLVCDLNEHGNLEGLNRVSEVSAGDIKLTPSPTQLVMFCISPTDR